MQTPIIVVTFLAATFIGIKLIKFVRAHLKEESIQYKILDEVFVVGNHVQSTITGKIYVVVICEDGAAFLRGIHDNKLQLVDWLTPTMTLRHGVAYKWVVVQKV